MMNSVCNYLKALFLLTFHQPENEEKDVHIHLHFLLRSVVYRTMLLLGMMGSSFNEITISDFDYEVLKGNVSNYRTQKVYPPIDSEKCEFNSITLVSKAYF